LHRLSAFLYIANDHFPLAIGFDGSLILPAMPMYQDKDTALDIFNNTLGKLLFGGLYSEAILPENVVFGRLTYDSYFSHSSGGTPGTITQFHKSIQDTSVGILDVITLLDPPAVQVSELEKSFYQGKKILDMIPRLSAGILLNGISSFVKHQWTECLITLWTTIEQTINHIWDFHIVDKINEFEVSIPRRKDFLKDYRTWTTSTKIEMLYQKNLIGAEEYKFLNIARKSRNDFIHEGTTPKKAHAQAAIDALLRTISLTVTNFRNTEQLNNVRELIFKHLRGELIPREGKIKGEVTHWMKIPPIPGDPDWVNEEYEVIPELQLQILNDETIKSIYKGKSEEELSRVLEKAASMRKKRSEK